MKKFTVLVILALLAVAGTSYAEQRAAVPLMEPATATVVPQIDMKAVIPAGIHNTVNLEVNYVATDAKPMLTEEVAGKWGLVTVVSMAGVPKQVFLRPTTPCRIVDTKVDATGQAVDRECSDNFSVTIDKLIQEPPGIVVMSSTWDLGAYGGDVTGSAVAPSEQSQELISSLTDAIDRLRAAGHQVIIVLPTPRFFHTQTPGVYSAVPDPTLPRQEAHSSLWRTTDCSTSVAQSDPADCGATVPQPEEDAAQVLTMEALTKIADATGSTTLDLRANFCSDGVCRTNVGDTWMFEDGIHITVDESEALAPTFVHLLKQVAQKLSPSTG